MINPDKIPVLRVEKITKSFGGLSVLFDVDFSIARGELVGLIGPSGKRSIRLLREDGNSRWRRHGISDRRLFAT